MCYLSAGNASKSGVSTVAVRSVQHQGCSHPGNLPHTGRQSSVDVPSLNEGLGSKGTPDYCHQSEPSQGFLFNTYIHAGNKHSYVALTSAQNKLTVIIAYRPIE